jgi:hypothetical protein
VVSGQWVSSFIAHRSSLIAHRSSLIELPDLDRYAQPESDPRRLAERREALTDQLAWLSDEAAALGPLLADLPDWALSQTAMPGERSVKEALAHIAALDRGPRLGWLSAIAGAPAPALTSVEPELDAESVAALSLAELLAEVSAARGALLEQLAAVPPDTWAAGATLDGEPATLYDVALSIARHDADELRALAYRLHEARLSSRAAG